jgi:CHAT domain-containing protein/Tfp pilus assembly protein PilF
MQRVLAAPALIVLWCAACATVGPASTEARLERAQAAFDKGQRLKDQWQYEKAVPHVERALELREAVLGGGHPEVASCLDLLGLLHRLMGDHARAEPLLQRALAIRETTLGKDHPDVATTLNNLGTLYAVQGLYAWAEPLYERALEIREAALDKSHPDLATSLYNLGTLYTDQGLYTRAEPLHERALAIRETSLGKHHPDVAHSLRNLGTLYVLQRLYAQAEPLYERALAIQTAALGRNHPDIAHLLANSATLYMHQGQYERAEPLLQRALAIDEAAFGKRHPHISHSLNELAALYMYQGRHEQAKPLLERALAIEEAAFGKGHPSVADSLLKLALLQGLEGHYARVEPLLLRVLAIREEAFGKSHPKVSEVLNYLGQLRLAQHRLAEALPLFERAFTASEEHLRQELFGFSEARLTSILGQLRVDEERLYNLARAHPDDVSVRRLALSAVLLRKGRSAGEVADTSRIIYRSLDQADREAFERLRALRTQLSTLSLAGPGSLSTAAYQQRLKEFAAQGDALEADLSRRSAPLRALSAQPAPDEVVDRVAQTLPGDGALVELVAYRDSPLVPKPGQPPSQLPGPLRYLALLLFADGRTGALDLGPTAPIDSAVLHLQDALKRNAASYEPAAQALHALAFRPLAQHLGGVQRLFLSPDGQLALVPFAALHDGSRFLVDSWDITYLTSGKDLLPRPEEISPARSVVVLADPEFASPTAPAPAAPAAPALAERSASLERFFSSLRSDLADQPWEALPGTRKEAETIQRLLPHAQLLLGPSATKHALLTLEAPGILHIATHGFFLEDAAAASESAASRAVGHFGAVGAAGPPQRPADPLLRSGLVLAGAHAPAPRSGSRRREDSLVTALELAGLNLWGTQLVVLSACDTGRGDVKLGQGVYGLRRALVVAGAESLVTSLWKVNDETTRQLMEAYYRNLLAGQGRSTALRHAMRALRQEQPHPHFWAPFIPIGKDGPLRGLTPHTGAQPAP